MRLGDLRLVQLDLSNNRLGKSNACDWDWLDRPSIKSSLQNLNLSENEVSFCFYVVIESKSSDEISIDSKIINLSYKYIYFH